MSDRNTDTNMNDMHFLSWMGKIPTPINKDTFLFGPQSMANAIYGTIVLFMVVILYFFILYLVSFIYLPIAETMKQESGMFIKFMNMMYGNPSKIKPHVDLNTIKPSDGFTTMNLGQYIPNTGPYIDSIRKSMDNNATWFQQLMNRFYMFFYIKNGAVVTTQKMNKRSFLDVRIN